MKLDGGMLGASWRRYGFWGELALAALLVAVAAGLVARTAARRQAELAEREASLATLVGAAATWRSGYVAPTPAESAAWRLSERQVRGRGVNAVDRVALAQLVAQRTEELGIPDVQVGFSSAEDLDAPSLAVDAWTFEMAPYVLDVAFVADYGAVIAFMGSLPPQVAVQRLQLDRDAFGVRTEARLIVYQPAGS